MWWGQALALVPNRKEQREGRATIDSPVALAWEEAGQDRLRPWSHTGKPCIAASEVPSACILCCRREPHEKKLICSFLLIALSTVCWKKMRFLVSEEEICHKVEEILPGSLLASCACEISSLSFFHLPNEAGGKARTK